MAKLTISPNPHIKAKDTTKRIMIDVVIALLPATVVGAVFFGYIIYNALPVDIAEIYIKIGH